MGYKIREEERYRQYITDGWWALVFAITLITIFIVFKPEYEHGKENQDCTVYSNGITHTTVDRCKHRIQERLH